MQVTNSVIARLAAILAAASKGRPDDPTPEWADGSMIDVCTMALKALRRELMGSMGTTGLESAAVESIDKALADIPNDWAERMPYLRDPLSLDVSP